MKKISLLIVPITLIAIGLFVFTGTKDVKAAYGDRAEYTLDPWTFWQTGVTTDDWNQWELSAYKKVYLPDDSGKYSDSTPGGEFNPREYTDANWFAHSPAGTHAKDEEREVTVKGVAHGYVATIESNGWSGKWLPDEVEPDNDPPKWGVPTTVAPETTSFVPYLIDNNPYTLRAWTTARGLKKNRTYTWKFDAYIDEGAYMAKLGGNVDVDTKYCKIVGKNGEGKILFVRYVPITTQKQTFMFNFDMDSNNNSLFVEMMYGSFLKEGPIIKYEEVVWHGTVHIEDCDIIQGNQNIPPETTTTRRYTPGGDSDWEEDTVAKVTGLKAKKKSAKKKAKKRSVVLSWSSAENATRYQVNYALKSNFKGGKSKYTEGRKFTVSGLKKKKTYYFRVRGRNDDDVVGAWSAKKKVKLK